MFGKSYQIWNEQVFIKPRIPSTLGSSSQTFVPRPWSIYRWNYLNGDPSISVFLHVAC